MQNWEKIAYLKEVNFDLYVTTRRKIENEMSDRQQLFCVCGKLATGLHERYCKKFQDKVNSAVFKELRHLLPKNKTN